MRQICGPGWFILPRPMDFSQLIAEVHSEQGILSYVLLSDQLTHPSLHTSFHNPGCPMCYSLLISETLPTGFSHPSAYGTVPSHYTLGSLHL